MGAAGTFAQAIARRLMVVELFSLNKRKAEKVIVK